MRDTSLQSATLRELGCLLSESGRRLRICKEVEWQGIITVGRFSHLAGGRST